MGKVYVGQDKFLLYIDTGTDLTGYSSVKIQGTMPDGTSISSLSAEVEDESTGLVYRKILDTDFTTAGLWTLWSHVTFDGGDEAWGEPFSLHIYAQGS